MSVTAPRILVADDVPENVRLLEAVLVPRGYEVVSASDGLQALEAARSARPDLVLLDVVMPGLDGFEVCRQLRAREDTAMLPVIMLTASEGTEKTKAIDAGADDFIPKPFNHDELLAPRSLAAPDQALPRRDRGAEPHARGARADPAPGARPFAAAPAVPLTAARRGHRLLRRRVDPRQPSPASGDGLRRPPRLDELRRLGRARRADARARRVPRDDRAAGEPVRRNGRLPAGRRRPALLQRPDRDPGRGPAGRPARLRAARGDGRADRRAGGSAATSWTSAPASRSAMRRVARSASRAATTTQPSAPSRTSPRGLRTRRRAARYSSPSACMPRSRSTWRWSRSAT